MHEPSIGPLWLSTSKIALKAEHLQTAYSAILQANQLLADFTFVQSAKLYKANGQVYRALLEMEQGLNSLGVFDATKKLDFDPQVTKQVAKVSNARSRISGGAASKASIPRLLCAALAGCKRQADLICKISMLATSAPSVSIARACLDRCLPDRTLRADAARVLYDIRWEAAYYRFGQYADDMLTSGLHFKADLVPNTTAWQRQSVFTAFRL